MADLNTKTAIIFDFGDVLVEWKFHNLYRKVFSSDAEVELFLETTGLREMNRRFDAGYPFEKGIAELCAAHPEYAHELGLFNTRWIEAKGSQNDEVIALMRELKAAGVSPLRVEQLVAREVRHSEGYAGLFAAAGGLPHLGRRGGDQAGRAHLPHAAGAHRQAGRGVHLYR